MGDGLAGRGLGQRPGLGQTSSRLMIGGAVTSNRALGQAAGAAVARGAHLVGDAGTSIHNDEGTPIGDWHKAIHHVFRVEGEGEEKSGDEGFTAAGGGKSRGR